MCNFGNKQLDTTSKGMVKQNYGVNFLSYLDQDYSLNKEFTKLILTKS